MRSKYRLQMQKNKKGKWFWRIRHKNGQILCTSEDYSKKSKAWQTVNNFLGALGGKQTAVSYEEKV